MEMSHAVGDEDCKQSAQLCRAAGDCWSKRQYSQCLQRITRTGFNNLDIDEDLQEWVSKFNRAACYAKLARNQQDLVSVCDQLASLSSELSGVQQTPGVVCLDVLTTHNLLACLVQQQLLPSASPALCGSAEESKLMKTCLSRVSEFLGCITAEHGDASVDTLCNDVMNVIKLSQEPVLHFKVFILMLSSCVHSLINSEPNVALKLLTRFRSCLPSESIFLPSTLQPSDFDINVLLNDSCRSALVDQHYQQFFGTGVTEKLQLVASLISKDYSKFLEQLVENGALAESEDMRYARALVLYQQDSLKECLEVCARYKHDVTEEYQVQWYNLLGCCFGKQGKIQTAIRLFAEGLRKPNADVLPLYNMSLCYREDQQHSAELECLQLMVKTLASQSHSLARKDSLLVCESSLVKHNSLFPMMHLSQALCVLAKRSLEVERFKEAVTVYTSLIAAMQDLSEEVVYQSFISKIQLPPMSTVHRELGYSQLQCGHYADASATYEKLVVVLKVTPVTRVVDRPDSLDAVLLTSQEASSKRKRSDNAVRCSDVLLEQCHCAMLQADAAAHLTQYKTALQCLNTVIQCCAQMLQNNEQTEEPTPKAARAGSDVDRGEATPATKHQQQVLTLLKDAYMNKASVLIATGEANAAVSVSRLALQLEPRCETALYNHSLTLLRCARWKDACHAWLPHRDVTPNRLTLSTTLQSITTKLADLEASTQHEPTPENVHLSTISELEKLRLDVHLLQILQDKSQRD